MLVVASVLSVVLLVGFLGSLLLLLRWNRRYPEPRLDWTKVDTEVVRFPKGFLWGVATSAHQVEGGCDNNNWSQWEKQSAPDGTPRISGGQNSGAACDHWNLFLEDLDLIRQTGAGAYRFSLEWSKIEPRPGRFDQAALDHYHQVLDALNDRGIVPMATLHHFTHPLWFERLGAFEKEENIPHFVRFCERVFSEYQGSVRLWCTVNEPAVFATMGYLMGIFPPGRRDPGQAAHVLRNLLLAHAKAYHALKHLPGGESASIGAVKNIFQLDPHRRWYLPDWLLARVGDAFYNEAALHYLRTGTFKFSLPGVLKLQTMELEVMGSLDFIGLNYYSHVNVKLLLNPRNPVSYAARPGDTMTDMPYAIYPEGFKRALHRVSTLGVPIYVTENGIADSRDDRRAQFIRRYLYSMYRAMEDGCDVRGYFYWTLMDNFEWAEGYDMKFGLFHTDFVTQKRTLRRGSRELSRIIREKTGSTNQSQ